MKVVVVGCGGIGGVIAATLMRAGVDVTPVVGNAQVADAVAERGLRVRELDGTEWSVPSARPPVLRVTPDHGPFDLAIFATQNTTLEAAIEATLPELMPEAVVVTCQNGLPEERAARVLGDPRRVVGCVVGWGASMVEPGLYHRTSGGGLQLGRLRPDGADPTAVAELLGAASEAVVAPDLLGVRWSKLAINCVTTTFGAIGGATLGRLLSHRSIRRLALEVFAEVVRVAQAEQVTVQPVGGTLEIDKIAITEAERCAPFGSPSLAYKHSILLAVGFKYRRLRSSMLYALERGRPPEIDFLNGEICRRGAAHGVPTPVSDALVEEVAALARKEATSSIPRLKALCERAIPVRSALAA